MIHHISIPAHDPEHVAGVLAELMGGRCVPFGPLKGAFMATMAAISHGTMIEVLPEGRRPWLSMPLGDDELKVVFGENAAPPRTWPFHALLSVSLNAEQVEQIGTPRGVGAPRAFGRGMQGHKPFFHVIEFWVENRLMLEIAPPSMTREYLDFLKTAAPSTMSDPGSVRLMQAAPRHQARPA